MQAAMLALFSLLLISACGGSDNSDDGSLQKPTETVEFTDSYRIEYVSGQTPEVQGRTEFTIKIDRRDDSLAAPGLAISVSAVMHMADHSHSTPVDEVVDNGDGTYSCAVYYLMASAMNGASLGDWELTVLVEGESDEFAVFYPYVGMPMGNDTVRATLKGQSDLVAGMSAPENRVYYLFNDGLFNDGPFNDKQTSAGELNLFIAAKESMMSYPPVSQGSTLHDENGAPWTIDEITVEASVDGEVWSEGADLGGGHWIVSGLEGLSSGVQANVMVRVSVNGEVKTTDGEAVSQDNGQAVFAATPTD